MTFADELYIPDVAGADVLPLSERVGHVLDRQRDRLILWAPVCFGIGIGAYFTRFLIPTLIGNTIGGVSLVAIINHAPVREELPGRQNGGAEA